LFRGSTFPSGPKHNEDSHVEASVSDCFYRRSACRRRVGPRAGSSRTRASAVLFRSCCRPQRQDRRTPNRYGLHWHCRTSKYSRSSNRPSVLSIRVEGCMKKSALGSCALLSSFMLLLAPLLLFGVDSPTKNSGINPADTYVTFDETVVTQSIFVQPKANDGAAPRASSIRSRTFRIEEGYDTAGNFVLNLTLLTPSPTIGHGVVQAKLSDGRIQFFDNAGLPVHAPYAGEFGPEPANLSAMVLTDHLPIQNIQAFAKACSATIISGSVPNGNSGQAIVTLQMPMYGKGGTFTKTFQQSDHGWILTQMGFSHHINNGTSASVISYSNMSWHHNAADDAERRSLGHRHAPTRLRTRATFSSGSQTAVGKTASCPTTVSHLGGPRMWYFNTG